MKAPKCVVVDFETDAIESRPVYPPRPVGVSIILPGSKPHYYSWGHPTGNNCDLKTAQRALKAAWAMPEPKLFHHAKFDLDVAETHMGCRMLPWHEFHDTMFLLFLINPHLQNLGLKPAAEAMLNMPPEERDRIREWLTENKIIAKNASDRAVGMNISKAPGTIVGPYANGDTIRTKKLFDKLLPQVAARGMLPAYDRDRKLLPHLLENERQGIPVGMSRLEEDLEKIWRPAMLRIEQYIFKRLGGELNLDSGEELADALERSGLASEFLVTKTGKRSVGKESLEQAIGDKKLFLALGYRSRLQTCMLMFMEKWLGIGQVNEGRIQPTWHQVRQGGGSGKNVGARSGRLIAVDPNVLNLSKSFEKKNDGYTHPVFLKNLPELPLVRKYMEPYPGEQWGHRDFNQQELRILAHFEDGVLLQAYLANPHLDVHDFVQGKIKEILNIDAERTQVKNINFGTIYGEGVPSLAEKMQLAVELIRKLKNAQLEVLPGLKDLNSGLKTLAKAGQPLTTWGGREYYCEEPRLINGRMQTFEYKMLNYLIQPSAADVTKEAILRYYDLKRDSRFLVTVYDEVNFSAPPKAMKREMNFLRQAMESVELDVPLLSDGKIGPTWGDLSKYTETPFDMKSWQARQAA